MPGAIAVRELSWDHLNAAIGILARGMRDNPLHVIALGDDADARVARLDAVFAAGMPLILRKGVLLGAFDDAALVAVAGMVPPGRCQPSMADKLLLLPRMTRALGTDRLRHVGQWLGAWAKRDLAEAHWHVGPVAVDAHLQGRGIGRALMTEYCARLDRMGAVGYLETDKPGNVEFYGKFEFQIVAEAPVLGIPNWFMRRRGSVKMAGTAVAR